MRQELFEEAERLLKRVEKIEKFSLKLNRYPYQEMKEVAEKLYRLSEQVPEIIYPHSEEELFQAELKRRLLDETRDLVQIINGDNPDFDTALQNYGVAQEDVRALYPWLKENKGRAEEAIEKVFRDSDISEYELRPNLAIPSVKAQAEEFAAAHVQRYHQVLSDFLAERGSAGKFLKDISALIIEEENGNSYFNHLNRAMTFSLLEICRIGEDNQPLLQEGKLINIYGHEAMGHALHYLTTHHSDLPYFLKKKAHQQSSVAEAIARFYQKHIFEDIKNSPETQKELGIKDNFERIYQESQETNLLEEYDFKLRGYAFSVLADKKESDLKSKLDKIHEVSLNPNAPVAFLDQYNQSCDSLENPRSQLAYYLTYCTGIMDRALNEFKKQGIDYLGERRSEIDEILLKGYWTTQGYLERAGDGGR